MNKTATALGAGTFKALTGANNAQIRVAEEMGIIAPTKADSGWRQFAESDVAAFKKWRQNVVPYGRRRG